MTKRKKIGEPSIGFISEEGNSNALNDPRSLCFKHKDYQLKKSINNGNRKTRVNKTLKQILKNEKPQSSGATYSSINAPKSSRPIQKYSDLSGLPTNYKDPSTRLHFFNCKEFSIIKSLKNDIINGYLELRKGTS